LGLDGIDEQIPKQQMNILAICTQRIGDVLLITPLIRSLKSAYPNATIDALVCSDTAQVMKGNKDIDSVIAIQRHSKKSQRLKEIIKLWNLYDMSVTTIPSDRARIYGWAASKKHYGTYLEEENPLVKNLMFKRVLFDNKHTHTVDMNLKLCDLIGIPRIETVMPPNADDENHLGNFNKPYVVVHPYPKFTYKSWTQEGWKKLLLYLSQQNLNVYISGGNDPSEISYCQELVVSEKVMNIAGKYSLSELSSVIKSSELFIGVDTSVTHLAAATGTRVIAVYGPTNPVKWGPWPNTKDMRRPTIWMSHSRTPQVVSNITLIQGVQECIPCAEEGCDKHVNSESKCLTTLKSETVIQQVELILHARVVGDSF
jgi:heptosyltransferase III